MSSCDEEEFPQELKEVFANISSSLTKAEEAAEVLLTSPRNELQKELSSLEMAKLDLISVYSINALYWTYLITQGVDPKTNPVKGELDRIKLYMKKVKDIEEKDKAPRLEKGIAKRIVRNAMFDLEEKKKEEQKKRESKPIEEPEKTENISSEKSEDKSSRKRSKSKQRERKNKDKRRKKS